MAMLYFMPIHPILEKKAINASELSVNCLIHLCKLGSDGNEGLPDGLDNDCWLIYCVSAFKFEAGLRSVLVS